MGRVTGGGGGGDSGGGSCKLDTQVNNEATKALTQDTWYLKASKCLS